jgi:hypothetical protein
MLHCFRSNSSRATVSNLYDSLNSCAFPKLKGSYSKDVCVIWFNVHLPSGFWCDEIFCGLIYDVVGSKTTQRRRVARLMNDELETMWKEAVVA